MKKSTHNITPFLWFDDQAEEAVKFYTSIFHNAEIENITRYTKAGREIHGQEAGKVMTVAFRLEDLNFTALNGGPVFRFTPAISFFVTTESPEEIDHLYENLIEGGSALMPLDKYPFGEKFGWVEDKFGLSWQLMLGSRHQKIVPCLMFCGEQQGKTEEAMDFYTSIFEDPDIRMVSKYEEGETAINATVKHAEFSLNGQEYMAMDSGVEQPFTFNEAISLVVLCHGQNEVNYYWNKLSAVREAEQCGWLKDQFGVSWQIVPTKLFKLMNVPDREKSQRVTEAMLQMKKIEIAELEKAYHGE